MFNLTNLTDSFISEAEHLSVELMTDASALNNAEFISLVTACVTFNEEIYLYGKDDSTFDYLESLLETSDFSFSAYPMYKNYEWVMHVLTAPSDKCGQLAILN